MEKHRFCIICGCPNHADTRLHSVPKDDNLRMQWMVACGKNLHVKSFICSRHFPANTISGRRLKKGALPSICPQKEVIPLPVERVEEPTNSAESISTPVVDETASVVDETPPIDTTHYIQEHEIQRLHKCCACMESLPNELYSAPVTMLCYDDKTVKDGLELILVPQLHQKEDDFDRDAIKDDDFVCDSCFMVLRNALKFVKKCLEIREQMKAHFQDEKMKRVTKIRKKEVATIVPDLHYCSFLPLRYSKVPEHDAIVSFKEAVPEFLISLQQNGVTLLQNCKTYENFYENKRVLLVGSRKYLNCPLCDERLVTKERLIDHFAEVHNLSKAYLMEPIHQEYEPNDSNDCQGCGKVFSSARHKNAHLNRCRMFACPYCDVVFNWSKLPEHTKQAHGDANPFKCYKCKLESSNYYGLRSHICNGRMCEHCGRTFFYVNRYESHKKNFCRLKKCRDCKKKISITIYDAHMAAHIVPCPKCGKVFNSRYAMRRHRNKHKTCLCPICGKECKALKSHLLIHDENRTKNIPCSQCPKLFYRLTEMQQHVKQAHCEMIICEICGEQVRQYYMKNHRQVKHRTDSNNTTSTPKEYKCETCNRSFANVNAFKVHNRRHAGFLNMRRKRIISKKYDRKNDPVFCKHCLKSFKNMVYLKTHMKTHTKSCRIRCRYCSNTYANVKCRWNHERRVHKVSTEEKQRKALPGFKKTSESNICTCEVCGELFQNVDLLNVHQEEFHNETKLSDQVVDELGKEMLLSFETLECDESLFFREESVLADNIEFVVSSDSDY